MSSVSVSVSSLSVVLAQVNPWVGDIQGNTARVIELYRQFQNSDVIVFPELMLSGYPPEDLLLRPSLVTRMEKALQQLCQVTESQAATLVVGYPMARESTGESSKKNKKLYNCAGVFQQGKLVLEYHKQHLPNYRVFDEKRYFEAGTKTGLFSIKNQRLGLTICEDIWHPEPLQQAKDAGANMMININASPFHVEKQQQREAVLMQRSMESTMPIIYVNQVGGQDELVFDGGSTVLNAQQKIIFQAESFVEKICEVQVEVDIEDTPEKKQSFEQIESTGELACENKKLHQALVLSLRDYVRKNNFKGVILGLSGGIDSALTLAIAVEALGAEQVEAVMMPFRYTADISVEDAAEQAKNLGVKYSSVPIESMVEAFEGSLQSYFSDDFSADKIDATEENIQARCRGVLLMALSNKKNSLVLTTGNKSELAVGYCTLYGDMVGGFSVLKDVFKMRVYALARYCNEVSIAADKGEVIPQRVIDRPPSAELAPDQVDQDSLPPYEILDEILSLYIEQDVSANDIIAKGFEEAVVLKIIRLVDLNEYKRRQAAIGTRVTQRAFGRDRRYPITSGWKAGE